MKKIQKIAEQFTVKELQEILEKFPSIINKSGCVNKR